MRGFIITVCFLLVAAIAIGSWISVRKIDIESNEGTILPFKDVPEDAWYYPYVSNAYDLGWIEGRTRKRFDPDAPLRRGDFARMLYRYLGQPDASGFSNPFTDLENDPCKDSVIYLKKLGILDGKTESLFAPAEYITREQLVTILYRLGGYKVDAELSPSGKFSDRGSISPWAMDAVDWAIHNGFLDGYTANTLAPQNAATRAEATKILCLYGELTGYGTVTSDDQKAVTLTVWQVGVYDSRAALSMKKLLNRFERRNPGITIEYVPKPTRDDPYEEVRNALKKDKGPDVILVSSPYDMVLADDGLVLPLDTLLTSSVLQDIYPGLILDCTYARETNPTLSDKLVSAPLFSTPRALLYNRNLLQYYGVSEPQTGYTYDALLSDAQKLTGAKDGKIIYGFGARAGSPGMYLGMVWNNGGTIINTSTGLAATNTVAWKKATEAYLSLYSGSITPDHAVSMDYNSQLGMFANGNVAMIDASLSAVSLLRDKTEWIDNLGIYPYLENAQTTDLCVGEVAVISHCTPNIVESAKLINFLMDPDSQIIYSEEVGYLPGVMSALNDSELKADAYLAPYVSGINDTAALGKHSHAVYRLIRDALQKVLRGELTVDNYCMTLEQKINEILTTQ